MTCFAVSAGRLAIDGGPLLDRPLGTLPIPVDDGVSVVIEIDYLGFTIEDVFVIGYGLDYAERYRNLPFIGVLSGA